MLKLREIALSVLVLTSVRLHPLKDSVHNVTTNNAQIAIVWDLMNRYVEKNLKKTN